MTTPTEIKETYTPTVQDKIQRVLYRLENGEELTQNRLYDGANFCVLGLFADESGLGDWIDTDMDSVKAYRVDLVTRDEMDELPAPVCEYYNMIGSSGDFKVTDLPESTQEKILNSFKYLDRVNYELSLMEINDESTIDQDFIKEVLVEVIRSGAIFK